MLVKFQTLVSLALLAPAANAQEPATVRSGELEQKPGVQQSRAAKAARESALMLKVDGDGPTYEAVLANPDNLELNYRWAKKQILSGDVKGASSTLERILMVHPNLTKVRLMRGIVLFRLDVLEEAERDFQDVKRSHAPQDEKAEAKTYLKLIASRRRRTHYSAALSLGWGFDDNRNAASSSGKLLFGGTPIPLTQTAQRHTDTALSLVGNIGAKQDLGFQRGHGLFESFTYYQGEQTGMKNLNLKAYSGRVGGLYKSLWADFTGTLLVDHIQLAQTTFLRDYGGDLKAEFHLSPRSSVVPRAAYQYQDYSPTPQLPAARQRNGGQWDFSLSWEDWVLPTMKLVPSIGYTVKDAASTFNAFRRGTFALDHTWLLGRGFFLLSSATANYDRYQAVDPLVSPSHKRSDDAYRLRTSLGAPLSRLYKPLEGFIATAGFEHYWAISNHLNYGYTSNKVSATLTYSWGI